MTDKDIIARRAARELKDGDVVNLGIGLPTLVASYMPENVRPILQSENGMLGMDAIADGAHENPDITNAGGYPVAAQPGASFFDSAVSFGIIRGGHVDITVLGALEVDATGSLASHIIPGKMVSGMGGAMDLVTGSKRVVVTMTHTAKDGSPKIRRALTLPPTAVGRVHRIITERAVIDVTAEGLVLKEIAEGETAESVQRHTEARLTIAPDIKYF